MVGRVTRWDDNRGIGAVASMDGPEFSAHHEDILTAGYATLDVGETVDFDADRGARDHVARNIRRRGESQSSARPPSSVTRSNGVVSAVGRSTRELAHELNAWCDAEGAVIQSVCVVQAADGQTLLALAVYSSSRRRSSSPVAAW